MMRSATLRTDILDFLDADTTWALVFADDVAALYLRRDGRFARQARESALRWMPGGVRALESLGERSWSDSTVRRELGEDVRRMLAASEWNGRTHALAANCEVHP